MMMAESRPSRRRTAATLPELQARAAFRACDRLMEHGADSEAHLWSVARVMCGEEYEQAAEERALAGKCGNPLCLQPPQPQQEHGGGRYRVSTVQQMVFERDNMDHEPIYCSPACELTTKRFATRLGSAALALERFTSMYQLVRQKQQQQQQQHVERDQLARLEGAAPVHSTVECPSLQPVAAEIAPAGVPATHRDSLPGGIKSSDALVPRLAVEQVEVKHIDSSAGQFGDFSRKPKPRTTANAAPQPKGVLKKQSQFAAGTARVPIMLTEVKERDPGMVAAGTAQGHQSSRGLNNKAAAAVEGYVPRASTSRRQRQQRRVRFTDDASDASAASSAPRGDGSKGDSPSSHVGRATTMSVGERAPPSSGQAFGVVLPASSVLVFDVEQPSSAPSEGAAEGLSAQVGRLRVADAVQQPAAAAVPAVPTPETAAAPSPIVLASSVACSGGVDIQQRSHSSSGSGKLDAAALPREWREVPQFYAHSPVGSSTSLAGSFVSPVGSSSNLAAIAVSSPPSQAFLPRQRYSSPPPGLPRAPTAPFASPRQVPAQQQQRQGQEEQQQQQQQHVNGKCTTAGFASLTGGPVHGDQAPQGQVMPAAEQLELTKQQAGQLQRAFPALSAVLPPELQAVLASDSSSASEGAESEDWMESDEDAAAGSSDNDDVQLPGSSSSYRVQLSFFGTLFTHLEAWITPETVELLASGPDVEVMLPPPSSPEVLAVLSRCLSVALTPVLAGLQVAAARGQVERCLDELLRTFRLVGPLPAVKVPQWQVVATLFLKALSLERCPSLREAFETRAGIGRLNRLLASLSFTCEEYWALLELLCPAE